MDSRDKRSSAVGVSLPWRGLYPAPDAALDQGDRQQAALAYRGILAGNVVVVPGEPALTWAAADPGLRWAAAVREGAALTWDAADAALTWQSRGQP